MALVDFHCHLDLYPDPVAVIAECANRGVYVLSVTTVPSAFTGTSALSLDQPRIKTALGLHPQVATKRAYELTLFEELLPKTHYVGEIGVDGSRDHRDTIGTQCGVLADILGMCARAGGKILSLHSRAATSVIIEALEAYPAAGTPVLHWFVGSPKQVRRASEIGCWFSVGPAMLTSERGRSAVAAMPSNRVVPESDGPFGTIDGRVCHPWEAPSVAKKLSAIWSEPQHHVEQLLSANFRAILQVAQVPILTDNALDTPQSDVRQGRIAGWSPKPASLPRLIRAESG